MTSLESLIEALRVLPGVGEKSAARMAYHLLQHDRVGAQNLSQSLNLALKSVKHCAQCYSFTDEAICATCADTSRDASKLCVVETAADQAALEKSRAFRGYYFVLQGKLNPLSGVGASDIGVDALMLRASNAVVKEVVIATNFTAEGEATAHVLALSLKARGLSVTRLARGIPAGSELEYVDLGTLAHSVHDRH